MTADRPSSRGYADSVPQAKPTTPRDLLPMVAGTLAVLFVLWRVGALVDRAWLDCAGDIEAGPRFAYRFELVVFVLPATLLGAIVAALVAATIFRRANPSLRAVAVGLALVAVAVVSASVWVPSPFRDLPAEASGGPQEAPLCRADGVPTWWPVWLPS